MPYAKLCLTSPFLCPRLWWISSTRAWRTWSTSGRATRSRSQVIADLLITVTMLLRRRFRSCFCNLRRRKVPTRGRLAESRHDVFSLPAQQWPWLERPILMPCRRWARTPWPRWSPESLVSFSLPKSWGKPSGRRSINTLASRRYTTPWFAPNRTSTVHQIFQTVCICLHGRPGKHLSLKREIVF